MREGSTKVRYAKVSYCLSGQAGLTCNAYYVQTENQFGTVAEVVVGDWFRGAPDPESDDFERLLLGELRTVEEEHGIFYNGSDRYVSRNVVEVFYRAPSGHGDVHYDQKGGWLDDGPWWAGWSRRPSMSPLSRKMFFEEKRFPKDLLSLAKVSK